MTSTTLAAALTASSQSVTLASGAITVGSLIAVDSEYLRVTERYSATAAKVQRGVNGSSSAAHDNGTDATIGAAWEFLTGPAIPPPFGPSDDALTAQGPSAAPVYAGGGGAGLLHQATVTLDNTEILTAGVFEIVAPTSVGDGDVLPAQIFIPVSFVVSLDTRAGAYGDVNPGGSLYFQIGNVASGVFGLTAFDGPPQVSLFTGTGLSAGSFFASQFADPSLGNGIWLVFDNASAPFIDGDPDNAMIITVSYQTWNTATGAFE